MAEFQFCSGNKAWTKICPVCNKEFIGTKDWDESQKIFNNDFDLARNLPDGLQAACKSCNRMKRRMRRGMKEHNAEQMFQDQEGKCKICCVEIYMPYRYPADAQGARVDHCHTTGKVRGLLCHTCNILVGMYEAVKERSPEFDPMLIENYLGQ